MDDYDRFMLWLDKLTLEQVAGMYNCVVQGYIPSDVLDEYATWTLDEFTMAEAIHDSFRAKFEHRASH